MKSVKSLLEEDQNLDSRIFGLEIKLFLFGHAKRPNILTILTILPKIRHPSFPLAQIAYSSVLLNTLVTSPGKQGDIIIIS